MTEYTGSCHCGKVRFRVTADLADAVVCNCSICEKKGFVHLIVEPSAFTLGFTRRAPTRTRWT
jgi:hypothetical protein